LAAFDYAINCVESGTPQVERRLSQNSAKMMLASTDVICHKYADLGERLGDWGEHYDASKQQAILSKQLNEPVYQLKETQLREAYEAERIALVGVLRNHLEQVLEESMH
jgi:hypothetical protein